MKEAIGYTLICGVAVAASVHYIKKGIKEYKAKRSDSKSFKTGTVQTTAKQIDMALHNGIRGPKVEELRYLISNIKSAEEMAQVATEYRNQTGLLLFDTMKDSLQDSEYNELVAINDAKPITAGDKVDGKTLYDAWARRLKAAFEYTYLTVFDAVNLDAIKAVFQEIPSQRAFVNVGITYKTLYKTDLLPTLKEKMHTWDYANYIKVITDKPKA